MDVVDQLSEADLDGDGFVEVGEILTVFGERAFGPLFMALALLQLLPTGLIPMVTDAVALLTLLFSWQLLIGAKHPLIPKKVRGIKIDALKVSRACAKARPFVERVSKWFGPRANILVEPMIAGRLIAVYAIILAVLIFFLGFIPGAADPVALALLLLGIGLIAKDGWAILMSYATTVLVLTVVYMLIEKIV